MPFAQGKWLSSAEDVFPENTVYDIFYRTEQNGFISLSRENPQNQPSDATKLSGKSCILNKNLLKLKQQLQQFLHSSEITPKTLYSKVKPKKLEEPLTSV